MLNIPFQALCEHQAAQAGTLYIVATPLGNLADLTLRAIRILETCDCIACETPSCTQRLLSALDIHQKKLFVYRDAGEEKSAQHLWENLKNGQSVALVSDAGTPTISDPGYRLVKLCREQNIPIVPIPGPSAVITALSASGFPSSSFCFLGFLPLKPGPRRKIIETYKTFDGTWILYESPYRIHKLIAQLKEWLEPERPIMIARELTKLNESFYRGPLATFNEKTFPEKGEFVILVAPYKNKALD